MERLCKDMVTYIQRLSNGECQSEENPPSTESVPMKEQEDISPRATPVKTTDSPPETQPGPTRTLQEVTLRREFQICGQIGEHGISYPTSA